MDLPGAHGPLLPNAQTSCPTAVWPGLDKQQHAAHIQASFEVYRSRHTEPGVHNITSTKVYVRPILHCARRP